MATAEVKARQVSAQVIDALNRDIHALGLLRAFEDRAAELGHLPGSTEYETMRDIVLLIALTGNEEAKELMFQHTYHKLRRGAGLEA